MPIRLIITIVMLITAIILGFTLTWPKFQDFQRVQGEVQQKKAELDSKTAYYSRIKELGEKLEKYEDVLSQMDLALPRSYSTPALFYYLQQLAGQNGVVLGSLNLEGVSGEKVKEIGVGLEVSGSYSSVKNFISALENSAKFFKIKSIGFSSSEGEKGAESFSVDLGITTYSY